MLVEEVLGQAVLADGEHGRQLVGLGSQVVDSLHLRLDGLLRPVRQLKRGQPGGEVGQELDQYDVRRPTERSTCR